MYEMTALQAEQQDQPAELINMSIPVPEAGQVLVRSQYSSINYKDALAVTGKGRILRDYPMIPGIDIAGEILQSEDSRFAPGDQVLMTGRGLGERYNGGYSPYQALPADNIIRCPEDLTLRESMVFGTAGFTAALAIHRMMENHQSPVNGPIAVTGATGGVGSFSVGMLSQLGYEVIAITRKIQETEYLLKLGASEVWDLSQLVMGRRPLEASRWGGAIDSVGGDVLAWLTRTMKRNGNIACIGLAAGHELDTTVMPFILRGVSLLGINSVECAMPLRQVLWQRMSDELKPASLESMVCDEISLSQVLRYSEKMLAGQIKGRCLVHFNDE